MNLPILAFVTAVITLSYRTMASGPTAVLTILDAAATPDGYVRQAVLPNGTFPGPLITGSKVSTPVLTLLRYIKYSAFPINRATTSKSTSSTR